MKLIKYIPLFKFITSQVEFRLVQYGLFAFITPFIWINICVTLFGFNQNYLYSWLNSFLSQKIAHLLELGVGVIPALILYYFWLCKYVMLVGVEFYTPKKSQNRFFKYYFLGLLGLVSSAFSFIFLPFVFFLQIYQHYESKSTAVDYMQYYFFAVIISAVLGTIFAMYRTKQFYAFQPFNRH